MHSVLSVYIIAELAIFPLLDTVDIFPSVINAAISLVHWSLCNFFSVSDFITFLLDPISLAIKCYIWTLFLEIPITYNLFNIS